MCGALLKYFSDILKMFEISRGAHFKNMSEIFFKKISRVAHF